MSRNIRKKLLFCVVTVIAMLFLCGMSSGDDSDPSCLYSTERINEYSKWFTNHVDGYRLMVQNSMEPDMSFSGVRTVLSNENYTIEIYPQTLAKGVTFDVYSSYGNLFIENDPDTYTTRYKGYMVFAGRKAYVLEYSRPALANVPHDKCYYASVDMPIAKDRVLTFLFKSTMPFEQFDSKYYILVLNTLTLEPRTAEAVNRRTEAVENEWWNEETRALYDAYFGPESGLEWGIFKPGYPYEDVADLQRIEAETGHTFRFVLDYAGFGDVGFERLTALLDNAKRDGRTVELTLQTSALKTGNMVLDTLDGKYDELFNAYARIVAESGAPVLFRLCNEMNGDWCVYSAFHTAKDTDLYKAIYRYVHRIFEENGALANTIWIWNPNGRSYPDFAWNDALCYYPGDEYVDVVGMTAYNTGTYYKSERWQSFPELYEDLYREYDALFAQPFMITEFACSSIGGDKAAWTREMLDTIGRYDRIRLAVWWDGCDYDAGGNVSRPYFIDDTPGVLEAFRDYFAGQAEDREQADQ